MPKKAFLFSALPLAALLCTPRNAAATAYTVVPLKDTAALGGVIPEGINNAGTVVGAYGTGAFPPPSGFVDQAGQVTTSYFNAVYGINDRGDIVSIQSAPIPASNAFSQQSLLTGPDAGTGIALPGRVTGINNSLAAVGGISRGYDSNSGQFISNGYLYQSGNVTLLNYPGSLGATFAQGINNAGTIVGGYNDASGEHGFLYSSGTYTSLDVPGAINTYVTGINDLGQVTGYYYSNPILPTPIGFTEQNGVFQDFSFGTQPTIPTGINNAGVIVGYYYSGGYKYGPVSGGGFVATPQATDVPEPASLTLFAAGLAVAGLLRRRAS